MLHNICKLIRIEFLLPVFLSNQSNSQSLPQTSGKLDLQTFPACFCDLHAFFFLCVVLWTHLKARVVNNQIKRQKFAFVNTSCNLQAFAFWSTCFKNMYNL